MPEVEVEVNGLGSRQGSLRPVSTADFSWVSPVYCLQVVSEAVEYTVKVLESLTSGLPHIMSSCCPGSWSCPLVQMHGVIVITDFLSREIEDPHTRAEHCDGNMHVVRPRSAGAQAHSARTRNVDDDRKGSDR